MGWRVWLDSFLDLYESSKAQTIRDRRRGYGDCTCIAISPFSFLITEHKYWSRGYWPELHSYDHGFIDSVSRPRRYVDRVD